MASTYQLTDGTTTISLVYDGSSQKHYAAQYGFSIATPAPQAKWHTPDIGPQELTQLVDGNRTAFFNIDVLQDTDIDEVLDKIIDVRRLLNQASRYTLHGDVDRVTVKIQRNNATNATEVPVLYGYVDDSSAHYKRSADISGYADDVVITLFLAPYGEASSSTEIKNNLNSSPHFIEDSDSDGQADGLTGIGGPTFAIASTTWLIGGQSQKVTTDSSTRQGFQSSDVTASSGALGVGYIWIQCSDANADLLTITLRDGMDNVIDTTTFDPGNQAANADKQATGANGNTWYRHVVSGTNSTADDFRLTVARSSGDASAISVYRFDGMLVERGTTTAPDMWMSS